MSRFLRRTVVVLAAGSALLATSAGVASAQPSAIGLISTFAGDGYPDADNRPAAAAEICTPQGVAMDRAGNVYFADYDNGAVREISGEDSTITTVAATKADYGMVADTDGDIYYVDDNSGVVREIKANHGGTVKVAGGGPGYQDAGDGGAATSATIEGPYGLALDGAGNLYIAELGGDRVRKVTPSGIISTVAGNGVTGNTGNGGPATSAELDDVFGVGVDYAGNLYISTFDQIRKVDTNGIISTIAGVTQGGFSGDGGPATSAEIETGPGIAVDLNGNVYFPEDVAGHEDAIREVTNDGIIHRVAGIGDLGFSGDGGPATSARTNGAAWITLDGLGGFYFADQNNQRIRRVDPNGTITTVTGDGICGHNGDGSAATHTALRNPTGTAFDSAGNTYIVDSGHDTIRKISTSGVTSTVAGNGTPGFSGDGGGATSAQLSRPTGIAIDGAGDIYIDDFGNNRIRKVYPNGTIQTVAGNGSYGYNGDGEPATQAELDDPQGIALDASGDLYIAEWYGQRVRKVDTDGAISTVAGTGTLGYNGDNQAATAAQLATPAAVTVDGAGNLYIADLNNNRVRKVATNGIITTVAGNGTGGFSGDGGPGAQAELNNPYSVAVDAAGDVYLSDVQNARVRKIRTDGTIVTVAGTGTAGYNGDGQPATSAELNYVVGLAVDGAGNLYLADTGANRVREVSFTG